MYNSEYYNGKAYNEPNSFTKTIAEGATAIGVTESLAKAPKKGNSDTVSLTDSITSIRGFIKSIADTLSTITESLASTFGKKPADTITPSDSISSVNSFYRTITETAVNLGEGLSKVVVTITSSTISLADALSKTIVGVVADTMSLAESFAKQIGVAIAETAITISENVSSVVARIYTLLVEDTLSLVDSITTSVVQHIRLVISDTISIAETIPKRFKNIASGIPRIVSSVFNRASQGSAIRQKPENNGTIKLANQIGSAVTKRPKY